MTEISEKFQGCFRNPWGNFPKNIRFFKKISGIYQKSCREISRNFQKLSGNLIFLRDLEVRSSTLGEWPAKNFSIRSWSFSSSGFSGEDSPCLLQSLWWVSAWLETPNRALCQRSEENRFQPNPSFRGYGYRTHIHTRAQRWTFPGSGGSDPVALSPNLYPYISRLYIYHFYLPLIRCHFRGKK